MKPNIAITEARKVTVTVTTKQLWENFTENMTGMFWDDYTTDNPDLINAVRLVANALCVETPSEDAIRSLFRNGYTCLLLGDLMKYIDPGLPLVDQLNEIVVRVPCSDTTPEQFYIVRHRDINY